MIKHAIFTLGLPGSGKSTFLESLELTDYQHVSADEIKKNYEKFPWKLEVIHEKSVEKAEELVYLYSDLDKNIIMDGGGVNGHYTQRIITHLKEKGYNITVYFINTPVNICVARNEYRFHAGQRYVPISNIIEKSHKLQDSVERLKELSDEFVEIRHYSDKNLFVDMDGVIAEYQELPTDEEGNVNFTSHRIFTDAYPVNEVINKLEQLYKDGTSIYILSASPNSICSEQKRGWLYNYMPFVGQGAVYFVGNKDYKHLMLRDLILELNLKNSDCTLIDDDHFILEKVNALQIRAIHPSKFLANF